MFGLSGTELIIVLVVALLVLGPQKLPDLARNIGKGLREFRRATDTVRHTVEQEFYKMDQEVSTDLASPEASPVGPTVVGSTGAPPAPALPESAPDANATAPGGGKPA